MSDCESPTNDSSGDMESPGLKRDVTPMAPKFTPDQFLALMKECATDFDAEGGHWEADKVMCELLTSLGYSDGVEVPSHRGNISNHPRCGERIMSEPKDDTRNSGELRCSPAKVRVAAIFDSVFLEIDTDSGPIKIEMNLQTAESLGRKFLQCCGKSFYRWLKPGETIERGDQCPKRHGRGWTRASHTVGQIFDPNKHYNHRRKVR